MLWWIVEGVYRAGKWIHKQIKLWTRKPAFGDSRFASLPELKDAGCLDGRGFPVGRLKGSLVSTHHEVHLIMVGITGAGKSLTQRATFHHAKGETIISFDPKGEHRRLYEATMQANGYETLHIDLDRPLTGARYDPFAFFQHSGTYDHDTDYDTLSRLVVGDWEEGGEDASRHFAELCFAMIAGVIADLAVHEPQNSTLEHVGQVWTVWSPESRQRYFDRMMSRAGNPTTRIAYNAFKGAGEKEKGSIITTLSRKLKPWVTKRYLDLCKPDSRPVWCWEDILNSVKPSCVFVTGGLGRRDEMAPFLRVFFGEVAASIARQYNHTGKPLLRLCKVLLDETDLVAGCKPLCDIVTQLRSAHVSVFMCFQSFNQIKQNFRGTADTLISNCDLVVTGGLKTPREYQDVAQLIGNRTVKSVSKGEHGVSESEAASKLFSESDMFKMAKTQHLCVLGNQMAILDKPFKIQNNRVMY